MKHQFRIVLVVFIGLFLITGVFSLLLVAAEWHDDVPASPSLSEFNKEPETILSEISQVDELEIQAYLPVLSTNFGKCMTIPTLLTPTNGAILHTLIPDFWWNNGSFPIADRVRLEIATDAQMNVKVTAFTGNNPGSGLASYIFSTNLNPGTMYYWRVYFQCDAGIISPYSEIWSFTTGSGGTILPPPTLISPTNGSNLVANEIRLEWNPLPGAIAYIVNYRPIGETWSIIQTEIDPQAQISQLQFAKTYEWWVRVRNDYGYSAESERWQFTTPPTGLTPIPSKHQKNKLVLENDIILEMED